MSPVLIAILVALGLVFIFYGYFVLLLLRYREPVRAGETYTISTEDLWQIKLYRSRPAKGTGETVFLCHSLSSNHLNFEMPAGESLVDVLTEAGHDCWSIDTRACRSAIAPSGTRKLSATLDDILQKDLPAALAFIQEKTGSKRVHWIGHSLGGMLLYAYVAKFGSDRIASGTTLGSPPGFKDLRLPNRAVLSAIVPFTFELMSFFFRGLIPFAMIVHPKSKLIPINWDNVHPKLTNAELFYAAEMPMPRVGGQLNQWSSQGVWRMCADTLDVQERLPEMDFPLFAIYGGSDPLATRRAGKAFVESLKTKDKKMIALCKHDGYSENYSHLDLVFAVNGREEVYEPIAEWIEAHSTKSRRRGGTTASGTPSRRKAAPSRKKAAAKKPAAKTTAKSKVKAKPAAKAKAKPAPKKKATANKAVAKPKAKKKPTAKKRGTT